MSLSLCKGQEGKYLMTIQEDIGLQGTKLEKANLHVFLSTYHQYRFIVTSLIQLPIFTFFSYIICPY